MVLTDDQRALQENARSLAHERLLPSYQKREKLGILDRALERELGDLGLPEQYGGMGLDGVTAGLVAEELAYDDFKMSAVPVEVSHNGAIWCGMTARPSKSRSSSRTHLAPCFRKCPTAVRTEA